MKTVISGKNDLATVAPHVSAEWDYENNDMSPVEIAAHSHKIVCWICKYGHRWRTSPHARVSGNTGCPYCKNVLPIKGVNDFMTLHPELSLEWNYDKNGDLSPDQFTENSSKKIVWTCKYNHTWTATITSRTWGSGCPYCNGKRVICGQTDLYSKAPELMSEWDYDKNDIDPRNISSNSSRKVWWKCSYGHSWQASPNKRYGAGQNCPYCTNRKVFQGFNDLATCFPELADDWCFDMNDKLPTDIVAGSNYNAYWKCNKGHIWRATVCSRAYSKTGCPYCNGKKVISGENDCATLFPHLLSEWDITLNKVSLSEVKYGSDKVYWWKCKQGHCFQASVNHRTSGRNCPYCAGKKICVGFNDLASLYPNLSSEWDYSKNTITPSDITAHSNKIVWWKCSSGHSWKAKVNSRTSNNTGCPVCNESHGEKRIHDYLVSNGLQFIPQYIFPDRCIQEGHPLKDDFALIDSDQNVYATIEFHGIQHYVPIEYYGGSEGYKNTIQRDMYKTKYLSDHNIPQLIISYMDYDNIENILDNWIIRISK